MSSTQASPRSGRYDAATVTSWVPRTSSTPRHMRLGRPAGGCDIAQQTFVFSASRVTEEEGTMPFADVMVLAGAHPAMRNVRPILYMYMMRAAGPTRSVHPSTSPSYLHLHAVCSTAGPHSCRALLAAQASDRACPRCPRRGAVRTSFRRLHSKFALCTCHLRLPSPRWRRTPTPRRIERSGMRSGTEVGGDDTPPERIHTDSVDGSLRVCHERQIVGHCQSQASPWLVRTQPHLSRSHLGRPGGRGLRDAGILRLLSVSFADYVVRAEIAPAMSVSSERSTWYVFRISVC